MNDAAFTPISPNPYIVGNPVRGRAMFFGREAEFNLIRKRFEHSEHGGLLVFCGERRSGKTSILFQILDHRLGPAFIPVLIDMQSMAVGSEAEFLTRVSEEILSAIGSGVEGVAPPDFSGESSRSTVFARFVQRCLRAQPGRKLILLFDEYELFENKIDAGLLSEDVLNILAALMENASVFMVFTGSQHLEQRRRDYWSILGKSGYKTVSYLEHDDALNLIRQPVAGRLDYDDAAVEAIIRLTAGQPFYTQAICQSLVDHLNDRHARDADVAQIAEVVDGIINNPLPQMIFLWDGLDRDEKLVLSLLAECIEDGDEHAGVEALLRHLKKRDYPLELDRAAAATTLEKLYKTEMLLRSDAETTPAYAFRMDLWRLWIRRQHSVWQVMREEGLAIRKPQGRKRLVIAAAVGLLAVVAVMIVARMRPGGDAGAVLAPGAGGFLILEVQPDDALLRMDGTRVGLGALADRIAAGSHKLEFSAAGFADTALSTQIAEGDTVTMRVALRPLLGDLRVETTPPGAEVRIDGRVAGRSPLTVRGLAVKGAHRVEASRDGFGVARAEVTVNASAVTTSALVLEMGTASMLVTTEPGGGEIRVDGTARGTAPVTAALPLGRHVFRAARDGYNVAETTLVVTDATRQLHLTLTREALRHEAASFWATFRPRSTSMAHSCSNGPYIAMEFVLGRTLRAVVEAERPPALRIVEIMRQVAAGLGAIHGMGMLHRDLSPNNIMVLEDGVAKILVSARAGHENVAAMTITTTANAAEGRRQTGYMRKRRRVRLTPSSIPAHTRRSFISDSRPNRPGHSMSCCPQSHRAAQGHKSTACPQHRWQHGRWPAGTIQSRLHVWQRLRASPVRFEPSLRA